MSTQQFALAVSGNPVSATDWNNSFTLVQQSLADIGDFIISGLTLSAGAGLAVAVSSGVAVIGAQVTVAAPFSVAGLANGTLNYIYLKDDGTGTSNTSGTIPADAIKIGTATTSGGAVTSTNILRDSGRQIRVRTENLVHGGSAGNPRAVDLSQWAASTDQPNEVKGVLPAGAVPGAAWAVTAKTANYTVLTTDYLILCNAAGGGFTITLPTAVGHSGYQFVIKKTDTTANVVTVAGNGAELIDTSNTQTIINPMSSIQVASDNTQFWMV